MSQEFGLLRTASFAGTLPRVRALEFSDAGHVCVLSSKALLILELQVNWTSGHPTVDQPLVLKRTLLAAPSKPNLHTLPATPLTLHSGTPLLNAAMLSPTLTPQIKSGDVSHKSYKRATWSSSSRSFHSPLLAAVTQDHQAFLWMKRDLKKGGTSSPWCQVCDLGLAWRKALDPTAKKDEGDLNQQGSGGVTELWSQMAPLALDDVEWLDNDTGEEDSGLFLVSSSLGGEFGFWRIRMMPSSVIGEGDSGNNVQKKVDVQLVSRMPAPGHCGHISCFKPTAILTSLQIGDTEKGSAVLWFGNDEGKLLVTSFSMQGSTTREKNATELWSDVDRMPFSQIQVRPQPSPSEVLVAGIKQNHLLLFLFLWEERRVGAQFHLPLGTLPLVGVSWFPSSDQFLLTSGDGLVLMGSVVRRTSTTLDVTSAPVVKQDLLTPGAQIKRMIFHGLSLSTNGLLCCLAECAVAFDHLALRNPIRISFYRTSPELKVIASLGQTSAEQFRSLENNVDLLVLLRVACSSMEEPVRSAIKESVIGTGKVEQMQDFRLKLCRLVAMAWADRDLELKTEVELLRRQLTKRAAQGDGTASELLIAWLPKFCSERTESGQKSNANGAVAGFREECPLCGSPVTLESVRFGACGEGKHRFPRCVVSQRLCAGLAYYKCIRCDALATDPTSPCPLCDGAFARR
ncbi:unnamed protein product [Cyprideis torosa]|uniref:Transcription factor IIIC putative zinc-finger domain-containing protein n=1 Tax=Cyprideis torosa TaxID=163714 RepID=A0A7R8ZLD6_9CRUS|nr:unnamed protein product [Cyprideis torosa]CAG0883437.1 unnamed protein product [Cyprideis torosa]